MQTNQQTFASGENALDRSSRSDLQDDQQTFSIAQQENQQLFQSAENALNRELTAANTDASVAASIMQGTMAAVATVYSDPNMTPSQKEAALTNVMNTAAGMPNLLKVISGKATSEDDSTTDDDTTDDSATEDSQQDGSADNGATVNDTNTGLLNSFEDYDLYDQKYGGEGQRP